MNRNMQSKKSPKGGNLFKYVLLSIVLVVGILAIVATQPPGGTIQNPKSYILAFANAGSKIIRVRWSKDGRTWSSSDSFPYQTSSRGVGATSSAEGLMNAIFWVDASYATYNLRAIWGLGVDTWDNTPTGPTLTQPVYSAPSAAYAGESIYLVAFLTKDDTVAVNALNSSTHRWLSVSLAPADSRNSNVLGNPEIAVLNGKVILAWQRSEEMDVARGDIKIITVENEKIPIITWTNFYTFSETENGFGPPISDPALTHDGSKLYLSFIRGTIGRPLEAEWLFVYQSNDGVTWENLAEKRFFFNAIVSMSARSDGSLLIALVGYSNDRAMYKYKGGTWTEILETSSSSSDEIFGSLPARKKFALISNRP